MGLFKDILEWLGGVVRDLVAWILAEIDEMSNESKIRRLIFRDELARLMENDLFFLAYSVWVIGMGVMGAGVGAAMATWWTWVSTQGWVAQLALKLEVSTWLLRMEQLRLISQIAAIIFPKYRAIVKDVMTAFQGISKIIYKDTEFLSGVMQQSRRVVYNALILSGHDPNTSELLSYLEADPWITKVNTRYRRYVENPYLIWDDLEKEIIEPALALFSEENLKRMEKYEEAYTTAKLTVNNLKALTLSVEQWIDIHPEEISEIMDNKIGAALVKINEGIAYVERNIIDTAGEILGLLLDHKAKQDARVAALARSIPDLKELIYDFYSLDPSDRNDATAMLKSLLNAELGFSRNLVSSAINATYNDYKADLWKRYSEPIPVTAPDDRLTVPSASPIQPRTPKGSWFIGEY